MAYTVSFGVISKRENSTSQSYTESLSASCLLKDNTDVLRPTFSLQLGVGSDFPAACNYMYCSSFGRYYWITGIAYYHGVWYISGEVDVLATYKTYIGNTKAYILRAASQNNQYIPDRLIPFTSQPGTWSTSKSVGLDADGVIVVAVAGQNSSETYYVLDPIMWEGLYQQVFTSAFLQTVYNTWDNVGASVVNMVIRPEDYISSAIWIPVSYTSNELSPILTSFLHLGFYHSPIVGKAITPGQLLMSGSQTLDIPDNPQAATIGKWLNGNIARRIDLFLPGYGSMPIDADIVIEPSASITVEYAVDCSGVIYYHIIVGSTHHYVSGNISTPAGWNETRANIAGALTSTAGSIASLAFGNVAGAISGIGSAIDSAMPRVERMVSGGSRVLVSISPDIKVSTTCYYIPAGVDPAEIGRPLATSVVISTLSGFIQTSEFVSVSAPATKEELEKIKSYLSGGFYYE